MTKRLVVFSVWLLLFGCSAGPGTVPASGRNAGADPASLPCIPTASAPDRLANQPGYRQLDFSVQAAGSGLPMRLTGADIRLFSGTREIPVAFFQAQPVTVGILVDTSASMSRRLAVIGTALARLVRGLNPHDEFFLVTFSDRPHLVVSPTADRDLIVSQLHLLNASGGRALYDAIVKGMSIASRGCNARKALLVVTNGMDNASLASIEQVIEEAQAGDVPIYSVGIGTSNLFRTDCAANGKVACVDSKTLALLAKDTGGETFVVAKTGDPGSLSNAITAAAGRIGGHYVVGFVAPASPGGVRLELAGHNGDMTLKIDSGQGAHR
jgi:VWFA-related protein